MKHPCWINCTYGSISHLGISGWGRYRAPYGANKNYELLDIGVHICGQFFHYIAWKCILQSSGDPDGPGQSIVKLCFRCMWMPSWGENARGLWWSRTSVKVLGLGNFSAHNQSPRASPAVHNQSVMKMVMIVVVTVLIDDISSIDICLQI